MRRQPARSLSSISVKREDGKTTQYELSFEIHFE